MRFGISATSSIFPNDFLTRFRPINVCAITSSRSIEPRGPGLGAQNALGSNHEPQPGRGLPRRLRYSGRSRRLSRGPLSIATVGTGVVTPYLRVIRPQGRITNSLCLKSPLSHPEPHLSKPSLLKLNLGADFFELRLDFTGIILVDAFLDRLGRALDQV